MPATGAGRALRRRSLLRAAPALLAGCSRAAGQATPAGRPLALDPLPPGSRLETLGGLVLDDAVIGFGGLSALHLAEDLRLTAISDLGNWLTARLVLRDGKPAGLEELRRGPLRDGSGKPLGRGFAGDAESLARLPEGGWLVGFERWHRIRAYATLDGPGTYVPTPPGLELVPANGGLESLTVLADGQWLAIAEQTPWTAPEETRFAWIGGPGRWRRMNYRPADRFNPADATALPCGGALVLERSFSLFGGFGTRLVRLTAQQLAGETELVGEEVLRFAPPLPLDNFEGVSAVRIGGRTLVAMVSDDNQNPLQRSLLLLFVLADD